MAKEVVASQKKMEVFLCHWYESKFQAWIDDVECANIIKRESMGNILFLRSKMTRNNIIDFKKA